MKKFLLAAIGLGLVVVSCGTKESSMSSSNSDSAAVDKTKTEMPAATDTTKTVTPVDTAKMKTDSTATVVPAK